MRITVFLIIMLLSSFAASAQKEWTEYIVGRPNIYYLAAKRTVAKEWGIAYKTELAGCIDCENTRLRAKELNKKNKAYFQQLEHQYGEHWLTQFNKDVAKRQSYDWAQQHPQEGVWYEFSPVKGDSEYYAIKKEVAAEWGIPYAIVFINNMDVLDPEEKRQLKETAIKSQTYLEQLQNRIGTKWMTWIERESQLRLLQKTAPQKGVWTDIVWGTPNTAYYDTKAAVAKTWGINYSVQFMGNERTAALVQKQEELRQKNAIYLASLHQHFPTTWLETFHLEVQQAYQQKLHQ